MVSTKILTPRSHSRSTCPQHAFGAHLLLTTTYIHFPIETSSDYWLINSLLFCWSVPPGVVSILGHLKIYGNFKQWNYLSIWLPILSLHLNPPPLKFESSFLQTKMLLLGPPKGIFRRFLCLHAICNHPVYFGMEGIYESGWNNFLILTLPLKVAGGSNLSHSI